MTFRRGRSAPPNELVGHNRTSDVPGAAVAEPAPVEA